MNVLPGKRSRGMDMLVNSVHCFYGFYYKCLIQNVDFNFYLKYFNVVLWNACPFIFVENETKIAARAKNLFQVKPNDFVFISSVEPKLAHSHTASFSNPVLHCLYCKPLTRKQAGKKITRLSHLLTSLAYRSLFNILGWGRLNLLLL